MLLFVLSSDCVHISLHSFTWHIFCFVVLILLFFPLSLQFSPHLLFLAFFLFYSPEFFLFSPLWIWWYTLSVFLLISLFLYSTSHPIHVLSFTPLSPFSVFLSVPVSLYFWLSALSLCPSLSLFLRSSLSFSFSVIGSRELPQDCSSQRNHILFSTTSSSFSGRHHGDGANRQRPLPAQPLLSLSFSLFSILPPSLSPCSPFYVFLFVYPPLCVNFVLMLISPSV